MRRFLIVAVLLGCVWGAYRQVRHSFGNGSFPAPLSKDLHAADYRGSAMPELVVPFWATKFPETKGKVILVDFWATWCPPCRAAIPELDQFQEAFKDDLVVIGVSDEPLETIKAFAQQYPMNYHVGTDPAGVTKNKLQVEGIPHVVIISTDGIVRWQGFPFDPSDPLTAKTINDIIKADPGIAKRHASQNVAVAH